MQPVVLKRGGFHNATSRGGWESILDRRRAIGPGLYLGTRRPYGCGHRRANVVRNLVVDAADALRHAQREAERAELKALYGDFITEASRLYGDALTHQTEEITGLVGLYAMIGRMRLASDQTVIAAAVQVQDTIVETYLGPNRTLPELMNYAHQGKLNFLVEFSEACRKDLTARATAVG